MHFKYHKFNNTKIIVCVVIVLTILSLVLYFKKYIQAVVSINIKNIQENYSLIIINKTIPLIDVTLNYTDSKSFVLPLKGKITSGFGLRGKEFHQGIDIAASAGTPICAFMSGKVSFSGWNSGGYGYLVIIDHSNGIQTYYGHNSKILVKTGESVVKGQIISEVGSTGDATGPHCHFEIRINGVPVNPIRYLK